MYDASSVLLILRFLLDLLNVRGDDADCITTRLYARIEAPAPAPLSINLVTLSPFTEWA